MIEFSHCNIEKVSVHNVGNKTNGEELQLSKNLLDTSEMKVKEMLFKFFLSPFSNPEYYSFTFTNGDFDLNPLFNFASQIFEDPTTFHRNSVNVAQHLYELSIHQQIKSGDLFMSYFSDLLLDDELIDGIGIYKSETRQAFLKLNREQENFTIKYDDGINIEKIDKACLIINTGRDTGFRVCNIDKSNRTFDAKYWTDSFLQLRPCKDDFHHTKDLMNVTKNFVTEQLTEEHDFNRTDQIDLLNRSVDYFKTHDKFEKEDFETKVLKDSAIINSFRTYDTVYHKENDKEMIDNFEISAEAVKKQARIFKSVLKLDKNFHIYIHGNRKLIEQGIENDGRKFYKIYFEQET